MLTNVLRLLAILSAVLFVLLFQSERLQAQSLSAGDIAIIGYNSDDPDAFAFVTLSDIPAGEIIHFTDEGWNVSEWSNTLFEGTISWEPDLPGISCGTIVTITETSYNSFTASTGSVSFSGVTWSLWDGDQILAYQGTRAAPSFLTAFHADYDALDYNLSTSWSNNGGAFARSTLPPGLTNGLNCLAVFPAPGPEADNVQYSGSLSGDADSVRRWIMDAANWTPSEYTRFNLDASAFPVPAICPGGCMAADLPVLNSDVGSAPVACGDSIRIYIESGGLNDAASWNWYTDVCGGTLIGTGDTLYLPGTPRQIFVRGEGGCSVIPGNCGSIAIEPDTAMPELICPDNQVVCDANTGLMLPLNMEDNCGIVSTAWVLSGATTDFGIGVLEDIALSPGTTVATYSVSDLMGNNAGCSFEIQFEDLQAEVVASEGFLQSENTGVAYQWISCSDMQPETGAVSQQFTPASSGFYAVVIDNGNCTDTSECVFYDRASGFDDGLEVLSLEIYPNPTTGFLFVKEQLPGSEYHIYTVAGELLEVTWDNGALHTGHLSAGVYLLVETSSLGRRSVAFIRE